MAKSHESSCIHDIISATHITYIIFNTCYNAETNQINPTLVTGLTVTTEYYHII
jgi:hypothetical protein